ncbi:hypothetical protein [Brachyspira pilosicoli]|uniref:Uncharacterized protein n=1 Tax=Brachyspira pilosicoli TaxID=52584 RepID=A0A5C8EHJ4_BRAPL|nr:hypothetical protein [Brachyspira pilosicoli]TXJ37429.1 hypothetical protein EPJ72_10535 [Brachyspira pilosicoli]
MKNIISIIVAFILMIAIIFCGGINKEANQSEQNTNSQTLSDNKKTEIKKELYKDSNRDAIYKIMQQVDGENENNFLYTKYVYYDKDSTEDAASIIIGLYEYLERKKL